MRAIRSKNTKPELLVRKGLHAAGFRFRLHGVQLPGKPDIVLPKYRSVIFIQGCFWHGHDCRYFKLPKTRTEFWLSKIQANRRRDPMTWRLLKDQGWNVIVVWECALKADGLGLTAVIDTLAKLLKKFSFELTPTIETISFHPSEVAQSLE